MARIRTVKPDLFAHPGLAQVGIEARYLFVGMLTEADDEGRLIDSPKRLAGALFPFDEEVGPTNVDRWLDELQSVGSIFRYASGEGRYISLPGWERHQRISHRAPSKLPKPSGEPPPQPDQGEQAPEDLQSFPELHRDGSALEVELEVEREREDAAPPTRARTLASRLGLPVQQQPSNHPSSIAVERMIGGPG